MSAHRRPRQAQHIGFAAMAIATSTDIGCQTIRQITEGDGNRIQHLIARQSLRDNARDAPVALISGRASNRRCAGLNHFLHHMGVASEMLACTSNARGSAMMITAAFAVTVSPTRFLTYSARAPSTTRTIIT